MTVGEESSQSRMALIPSASMDGVAGAEAQRLRKTYCFIGLFILYTLTGMLFFFYVEGWNPLETSVFMLQVLTGIGYGHIAPVTCAGELFSSFYILSGLVVFATILGWILDFICSAEIGAVLGMVKHGESKDMEDSYRKHQKLDKWFHFQVGCANLVGLSFFTMLLLKFGFRLDFSSALYQTSLIVFKLDSLCLLDAVDCWDPEHKGKEVKWLIWSILWYIVTYSIVAHFIFATSNWLGVDPQATVSRVSRMTSERFHRMDQDADGEVSKREFLQDRLIRDGLVSKQAIEDILENFDQLDKDGSGKIHVKEDP
eukprot:TRINITY_DN89997_c0_g1_i1.p1 TRINITY_DN89997_c0_g1~~TRINITY_DN89997_c0_g1_i1.p1  ORF type:complete len:350 (+),score=62.67 TRINITY_DN89997_c0_g1_i1:113-1051(+)